MFSHAGESLWFTCIGGKQSKQNLCMMVCKTWSRMFFLMTVCCCGVLYTLCGSLVLCLSASMFFSVFVSQNIIRTEYVLNSLILVLNQLNIAKNEIWVAEVVVANCLGLVYDRYSLMPRIKTHSLGSVPELEEVMIVVGLMRRPFAVTHTLFCIGLNQVMLKKPGAIIRMELWPASLLRGWWARARWPSVVTSSQVGLVQLGARSGCYCGWQTTPTRGS